MPEQDRWTGVVVRRLPEMYVACALWVTLLLCVLTPPFFAPDELSHALRAMQLAHGQLIGARVAPGSGGWLDANVIDAGNAVMAMESAREAAFGGMRRVPDGGFVERNRLRAIQDLTWSGKLDDVAFANTVSYPPLLYLPQIAGWWMGEHLQWTVVQSERLARIMAALTAVVLGWLALRLCRCGRPLIFGVLLLPTVLSLNASCSQDAIGFAVVALAVAIVTRALAERRDLRWAESAAVAALLLASGGGRPPYVMLSVLLVLPVIDSSTERPLQRWRPVPWMLLVVGAVIVWQRAVHHLGSLVKADANPAAQRSYILHHPATVVFDLLTAPLRQVRPLVVGGFASLGTNNVIAPWPVFVLLGLGALLLLAVTPMLCLRRGVSRGLLVVALVGAVFGVSLAEFLVWTPAASHVVGGLQSRYYLPLLFPCFLLLPAQSLVSRCMRDRLLLVALLMIVPAVLWTPWVAAHRFYGEGLLSALRVAW
jgi:uncharacterized membrane protein